MKKVFINKSRMYYATKRVLDNYVNEFAGNSELNEAFQQLISWISVINIEEEVLVVDNTGLTTSKDELRVVFTLCALKMATGLKAYATTLKDTKFFVKVNYQLNDFNRLPDPILLNTGSMLFKLADPMRDKLARFFLTNDDFAGMEKMLVDFAAAFSDKRIATTVSKSSNQKVNEAFISTDKLLKEVIDILVAPYQYQNPDFFREYTNARIIVGYTGRGKIKPDQEPPAEGEK
ncbi:MAG: hypothetical protein GZ094_19775 [Mariniphaga sp.]|nr:hypothetical protein [Mariniphaga sp.]